MLSKKHRIPSFVIPFAFKKSKQTHSESFTIYLYQPDKDKNLTEIIKKRKLQHLTLNMVKFQTIISKKTFKRAVERNKIKRRLNNILKSYLSKIKSNFWVIVLVKKSLNDKSFLQIKSELELLLKKTNAIKASKKR